MDQTSTRPPTSEESSSSILSADDEIHTFDEFLRGNANEPTESLPGVSTDSVWRIAPGMCAFNFHLLAKNNGFQQRFMAAKNLLIWIYSDFRWY